MEELFVRVLPHVRMTDLGFIGWMEAEGSIHALSYRPGQA